MTALVYLEDSRPVHLPGMRACRSKDRKRRAPQCTGERAREHFGSSFYMLFSSPWACTMQIGLRQERCSIWSPHSVLGPSFDLSLLYLKSSLWSLDLPLTFLCSIWSPHSGPWTFLWPFSVLFLQAFPFLVFWSPPFWTPFPYSNYLKIRFFV